MMKNVFIILLFLSMLALNYGKNLRKRSAKDDESLESIIGKKMDELGFVC